MCFVVFCGVLRVFCDVLQVLCECFVSVLQYFHKTRKKHAKNIETHLNKNTHKTHNTNTLVYCGRFPRAKNRDCIAQNTFHNKHLQNISQNTAKHSQNTKQSQNAFCVLRNYVAKHCKTDAKRLAFSVAPLLLLGRSRKTAAAASL